MKFHVYIKKKIPDQICFPSGFWKLVMGVIFAVSDLGGHVCTEHLQTRSGDLETLKWDGQDSDPLK